MIHKDTFVCMYIYIYTCYLPAPLQDLPRTLDALGMALDGSQHPAAFGEASSESEVGWATAEALKLQCDRPPTPNQGKKADGHKSSYIHFPRMDLGRYLDGPDA